ncbi:MAG: ribosome maturation factor RimP [Halanaerobiales bacterium]
MAEPIVKSRGLEIVDVEYVKEGENWVLRIFIENRDGKLKVEDYEHVSRLLSKELDFQDPIKKSYILEVSSPGAERPLRKKEEYRRFSGEKVYIKTYAPLQGQKEFTGILLGLKENIVRLKLDNDKGVIQIPYDKIAHSNLTIDF